jgi:hypothetical protein
MPSKSEWLKSSSVLLANRNSDPILTRIDNIVEAYEHSKSGGECIYLYGELFFATDLWLKVFNRIRK